MNINEILLASMCLILMVMVVRMAGWILRQADRIRELEKRTMPKNLDQRWSEDAHWRP